MKFLIIIITGLILSTNAPAQTWSEWFKQKKTQKKYLIQQIVALKAYLEQLKEGYDIVKKGLNTIGDIRQGKFDLDQGYIVSLKDVNSTVSGSAKITAIVAYQRLIMNEFRRLKADCGNASELSIEERQYMSDVYHNILKECDMTLEDVRMVVDNAVLEMKDDERIARIDQLYADMKDKYRFSRSFSNSTRVLMMQRASETNEIQVFEDLTVK